MIADLNERLPFEDGSFNAAVCQNVIECLADPQAFIAEAARILAPGGYLLLGHSDFDTLVFSATDLALTRRLVHRFCDTVQPWMIAADGRRDPELRDGVDGWLADLEEQARQGEFFYSLNDYAVLLRKPAASMPIGR